MKTVTETQAIALAIAFSEYSKVRIADLDTRTDYMLAAQVAKVLFHVQDEVGVVVTDPERLIRLSTRLDGIADSLARGA